MSAFTNKRSNVQNLTKETKLGADPEEDNQLRNKEERFAKERQYKELYALYDSIVEQSKISRFQLFSNLVGARLTI